MSSQYNAQIAAIAAQQQVNQAQWNSVYSGLSGGQFNQQGIGATIIPYPFQTTTGTAQKDPTPHVGLTLLKRLAECLGFYCSQGKHWYVWGTYVHRIKNFQCASCYTKQKLTADAA